MTVTEFSLVFLHPFLSLARSIVRLYLYSANFFLSGKEEGVVGGGREWGGGALFIFLLGTQDYKYHIISYHIMSYRINEVGIEVFPSARRNDG